MFLQRFCLVGGRKVHVEVAIRSEKDTYFPQPWWITKKKEIEGKSKEKMRDQAGCYLEYLSSRYVPRPGTGAVPKDLSRVKFLKSALIPLGLEP